MTAPARILFVGEAVTLAHIVRPRMLAESLPSDRYSVLFASDSHLPIALEGLKIPYQKIFSRTPHDFLSILKRTGVLFDKDILDRYHQEELALIDQFKPDIVVGDLRPSLCVSTQLRGIPLITLTNAYWSPFAKEQALPYPTMEGLKTFGITGMPAKILRDFMSRVTRPLLPKMIAAQSHGIDTLLQEKGFAPHKEYKSGFVFGDVTLYSDIPGMVPMHPLPEHHKFIGPVLWSPNVPLPSWWENLPSDKPLIFVNLGSSGDTSVMPKVLKALKRLSLPAIIATAGRVEVHHEDNLFLAPYLSGEAVMERASAVLCNGGSPAGYQSLAKGKPIIGIASNLDQLLFARAVDDSRTGVGLRADSVSVKELQSALEKVLTDKSIQNEARQKEKEIKSYSFPQIFNEVVNQVLEGKFSNGRVHNL